MLVLNQFTAEPEQGPTRELTTNNGVGADESEEQAVKLTATVQQGLMALGEREAELNQLIESLQETGFAALDELKTEFAEGCQTFKARLHESLAQRRDEWVQQSADIIQCHQRIARLRELSGMLNSAVHSAQTPVVE